MTTVLTTIRTRAKKEATRIANSKAAIAHATTTMAKKVVTRVVADIRTTVKAVIRAVADITTTAKVAIRAAADTTTAAIRTTARVATTTAKVVTDSKVAIAHTMPTTTQMQNIRSRSA